MTSRRKFIRSAAAVALLTALHPCCGFSATPTRKLGAGRTLIRKIGLQTAVPLAEMKAYYQGIQDAVFSFAGLPYQIKQSKV